MLVGVIIIITLSVHQFLGFVQSNPALFCFHLSPRLSRFCDLSDRALVSGVVVLAAFRLASPINFYLRKYKLTEMLSRHKTRKRYLEPDAAPYEQMPRSTAHRLRIGKSPTGSSTPSLPSSETLPSTEMSDCTSDAEEDSCTEESDTAERESARGSYHSPRVDRPFVEFATPLGNGTSFSVGDALVLIMDYAIEEGLAWSSIEKLLKLQNHLLGTSCLPESKYRFRKFASASPDDITFHF